MASHMVAFSLAYGLARRAGLDPVQFMDILRQTVLHAPTFDKKLDRIATRNFLAPHFATSTLLKDVDLVLDAAAGAGLEAAGLEGVRRVLALAVEKGQAGADYSSVYEIIDPAS